MNLAELLGLLVYFGNRQYVAGNHSVHDELLAVQRELGVQVEHGQRQPLDRELLSVSGQEPLGYPGNGLSYPLLEEHLGSQTDTGLQNPGLLGGVFLLDAGQAPRPVSLGNLVGSHFLFAFVEVQRVLVVDVLGVQQQRATKGVQSSGGLAPAVLVVRSVLGILRIGRRFRLRFRSDRLFQIGLDQFQAQLVFRVQLDLDFSLVAVDHRYGCQAPSRVAAHQKGGRCHKVLVALRGQPRHALLQGFLGTDRKRIPSRARLLLLVRAGTVRRFGIELAPHGLEEIGAKERVLQGNEQLLVHVAVAVVVLAFPRVVGILGGGKRRHGLEAGRLPESGGRLLYVQLQVEHGNLGGIKVLDHPAQGWIGDRIGFGSGPSCSVRFVLGVFCGVVSGWRWFFCIWVLRNRGWVRHHRVAIVAVFCLRTRSVFFAIVAVTFLFFLIGIGVFHLLVSVGTAL
mmetsp:Transcript_25647/g.70581  ORF Transcript_25647/g.70581 Transcript_25647/m.70581 type:complete len:454 (-) Transcript_25647:634-1995(-)